MDSRGLSLPKRQREGWKQKHKAVPPLLWGEPLSAGREKKAPCREKDCGIGRRD